MVRSKYVKLIMPILKQQVDSSPNFVSLSVSWKIIPLYFFSSNIYTFLKRSILKWKCLRLSSARVKIRQIPHVNVKMTSQFLFKFCIILLCHDTTPLWILSSHFFYFGLKDPIEIPIFRLSSAAVKIGHIPHVSFQTTSQFFFKFGPPLIVMKYNSSVRFQVKH